ncbi:hypothetical protein LEP3755_09610 [Leptolyngbya sp. NIES-3755]|nr:hypothetical protein LEP3755_09610 [Leptolyngbya sp. NIES-3755]
MSTNPRSTSEPIARSRLRQEHRVRNLILDYALGISILGLIPIPRIFTLKLIVAFGLILKMIWDIGKQWHWRRGQDFLAIVGLFFGVLGALAMAFMAWATFVGLGVFVPYVKGFAIAAALFTLPWAIGQTVNQFFLSGNE